MNEAPSKLNPLDAAVAMRLAFWSYPHRDIEAAEKIAKYPDSWEHAKPGKHLPANFNGYTPAQAGQPAQEGWNTQHNAKGELINQFKVSINKEARQITFDFKGSDNVSNFKSDFGNAGASEFARIEAQAQRALEAMKENPDFKGFSYATTGHSLGGGMAQSFALRNNLDAYVYNSLPIARDTIQGDYFQAAGGYGAALARYQASGRTVHDVRTPNDIATTTYDSVMRNQYLSDVVPPGPQRLPGAAIPGALQGVALSHPLSAAVVLGLAANDHTMGTTFDAQHGLGIDPRTGRYVVPEGHVSFAAIPPGVRKELAGLSSSPVTKVFQSEHGGTHDGATSAYHRFELSRQDGSTQRLSIHVATGEVELDHRHADGRRTEVKLDPRHPQGMQIREFPAETLGPETAHRQHPASLTLNQQRQLQDIHARLAPGLGARGYSAEQIGQLSAATLAHLERHSALGEAQGIHLSKDGTRIAVRHEHHQLSEIRVADALQRSTGEHLQAATRQGEVSRDHPSAPSRPYSWTVTPPPPEHTAAVHR